MGIDEPVVVDVNIPAHATRADAKAAFEDVGARVRAMNLHPEQPIHLRVFGPSWVHRIVLSKADELGLETGPCERN